MPLTTRLFRPLRRLRHKTVRQGPKARIARSTSQLNYVADARCHMEGGFEGTGMRVALPYSAARHNADAGRKRS